MISGFFNPYKPVLIHFILPKIFFAKILENIMGHLGKYYLWKYENQNVHFLCFGTFVHPTLNFRNVLVISTGSEGPDLVTFLVVPEMFQ